MSTYIATEYQSETGVTYVLRPCPSPECLSEDLTIDKMGVICQDCPAKLINLACT